MSHTLSEFIRQSNAIEGIERDPTPAEIAATNQFLGLDKIYPWQMEALVSVYQPDARLRAEVGMNVQVGNHIPPFGGPEIKTQLKALLQKAWEQKYRPYTLHRRYESLHPFTDGNGRSGRALWLWMMGGVDRLPSLGFLHVWYYQSLEEISK